MASSSKATRLLLDQLKGFHECPMEGFSARDVDEDDIRQWNVTFHGLEDTPSQGRAFHAIICFPQDYPESRPTVMFLSEIKHPDVLPNGEVSAGRLSPAYTVENTVLNILAMLSSPVRNSPVHVAAVVRENIHVTRNLLSAPGRRACAKKEDHHFEEDKSLTGQFICYGCKQQGSGPRYVCRYCNHELHKECWFPKPTASHVLFGSTEFWFFDTPQVKCCGRCCNACGKDILGFNYQSVDGKRDLHPCCAKLLKKFHIKDTVFELCKKIKHTCIWCKEKKIRGGIVPGWGYASRCGDYHFHVHCMMEMLHTNASIKDGNLGLEKIDLHHVAQKSKGKKKEGWKSAFSMVVKVFLETVLSVLLGDPTGVLATAVVGFFFKGFEI